MPVGRRITERQRRHEEAMQARRDAWDHGLRYSVYHGQTNEYNALHDINMRHYFENEKLQAHLYSMGLIDKTGRVINLDKNKSKLHVIQHEFYQAEKAEYWRQKEEAEMRERVQKKRFEALERMKRQERILRMREDCRIRNDIVAAIRRTATASPMESRGSSSKSRKNNHKVRASSASLVEGNSRALVPGEISQVNELAHEFASRTRISSSAVGSQRGGHM